jgi:hypothetical protein
MREQSLPGAAFSNNLNVRYASFLLAFVGFLALFGVAAAWWNIFRQPKTAPTTKRLKQDGVRLNSAAIASVVAVGLCTMAAILAIIGWFDPGV